MTGVHLKRKQLIIIHTHIKVFWIKKIFQLIFLLEKLQKGRGRLYEKSSIWIQNIHFRGAILSDSPFIMMFNQKILKNILGAKQKGNYGN